MRVSCVAGTDCSSRFSSEDRRFRSTQIFPREVAVNNLSLKAKLAAGFGTLLAILIAMSIVSYTSVQKLSELSAFADQKAQGRFYATSIQGLINAQKGQYRSFLLTDRESDMTGYAENNR